MKLYLTSNLIDKTLYQLQRVGKLGREYMIFWLGVKEQESVIIKEIFIPFQTTSRVSIKITEKGMRDLFDHLRKTRFMLAAQIHIHPREAYHSEADNLLAILKHEGALSLVLPWFGLKSTPITFLNDAVCYVFTREGQWVKANIKDYLMVKKQWIV